MSKVWAWIFGIAIALCILGLMAYGRSERQAYWAARGVRCTSAPDSRPAGREVAVRTSEPVGPIIIAREAAKHSGATAGVSAVFRFSAARSSTDRGDTL